MTKVPGLGILAVALAIAALGEADVAAQEFEPRTYAVAPIGLNFLAVGYGYATGAVFMDPALPVEDVDSQVHLAFARYTRTLSLFGRPSKVKVFLPWSSGHWDGFLEGEFRTRDTTGIGDARVVIETLFTGTEVKTPRDMAGYSAGTVWGARLQVVVPTGSYDNTKVINLGSNRWGLIPEVGFSRPVGKWTLEAALGAWFFGDNNDFVEGLLLEQDPLLVAKCHAVRSIRPGFWWAVAAGVGYGGRTYVDGVARATVQRNWRLALMVAYPITPTQGVSVSLNSGGNRGAGNDADAIAVAYQFSWGNK